MATKIRLARYGAKKNPFYRIVVADSEAKRDGRFIEIVGTYNPLTDPASVTLKEEKLAYWIQKGAQPTTTVKNIIKNYPGSKGQPVAEASSSPVK